MNTLRPEEAQTLLKLCNRIHQATGGPSVQVQLMLRELCRLMRAQQAAVLTGQLDGRDKVKILDVQRIDRSRLHRHPDVVQCCGLLNGHAGAAAEMARCLGQHWQPITATGHCTPQRRGASQEVCLHSVLPLRRSRVFKWIVLGRCSTHAQFTSHDCTIMNLLHPALEWIYNGECTGVAHTPAPALTPRMRQTLERLLAGDSEKQIARKLGLSPHTVHAYVKTLHKRFGVSTRAELLARCLRS